MSWVWWNRVLYTRRPDCSVEPRMRDHLPVGSIYDSTSGHTQFSSFGHVHFTTSSAHFTTSVDSVHFFILDFTMVSNPFPILGWVQFFTLDTIHFSLLG
ncbi:hypothetical protein MHYP_G00080190 [Metynnis hypsauchen]